MKFHIGLIGCGMVGRVHLDALFKHPLISTVSLAEPDPAQVNQLSINYQFRNTYSDYKKLLANSEIDVVDICLPHDMHYPVVLQTFQAGKHVILEKPLSNTLAEADAMISAASSAGKRLYVALNERFLPVYQKVKEVILSGNMGKIVLANLVVAGSELERMNIPEHWKGTFGRAGGGALADSGTHVVDLALDWFGMPDSVHCSLGRFVVDAVNKAEDTAALTMKYPDKIVNILVTYAANGQNWSETRSIWGETGSIHTKIESSNPMEYYIDHKEIPVEVDHKAETWWQDSVKAGIDHAIHSLADEKPFLVTAEDARKTLKVIQCAYTSAALNRYVRLDEPVFSSFDSGTGTL